MLERKLINIDDFIFELEVGIFKERFVLMFIEFVFGVVVNNVVGKVKIEFNIKCFNDYG